MPISQDLLTRLQYQLAIDVIDNSVLDITSIHCNSKLDVTELYSINETMPDDLIKALLNNKTFSFEINTAYSTVPNKAAHTSAKNAKKEQKRSLNRINSSLKKLQQLNTHSQTEQGVNNFVFGFPLLLNTDADGNMLLTPVYFWSLTLQEVADNAEAANNKIEDSSTHRWQISRRANDPVYLNPALIDQLSAGKSYEQLAKTHKELFELTNEGNKQVNKYQLLNTCTTLLNHLQTPPTAQSINANQLAKLFQAIDSIHTPKYYQDKLTADYNQAHEQEQQASDNSDDILTNKIHFAGLFTSLTVTQSSIFKEYITLRNIYQQSTVQTITADIEYANIENDKLSKQLATSLATEQRTLVVSNNLDELFNIQQQLQYDGIALSALITDLQEDRKVIVDEIRDYLDSNAFTADANQAQPLEQKSTDKTDASAYQQFINEFADIIEKIARTTHECGFVNEFLNQKIAYTGSSDNLYKQLIDNIKTQYADGKHFDVIDFSYDRSVDLETLLTLLKTGDMLNSELKETKALANTATLQILDKFAHPVTPVDILTSIETDIQIYRQLLNNLNSQLLEYENAYHQMRQEQFNGQLKRLQKKINTFESIVKEYSTQSALFDEDKTGSLLFDLFSRFNLRSRQILNDKHRLNKLYEELVYLSWVCKDFPVIATASNTREQAIAIDHYSSVIYNTIKDFANKVQNEFNQSNCLTTVLNNNQDSLSKPATSTDINHELQQLKQKIIADNWLALLPDLASGTKLTEANNLIFFESFIQALETETLENLTLISHSSWVGFLNCLTDTELLLIKDLMPHQNWQETFLLAYLADFIERMEQNIAQGSATNALTGNNPQQNSLAASAITAQTTHPLTNQLTSQELWYKKQQQALAEYAQKQPELKIEKLFNKRKTKTHDLWTLQQIISKAPNVFNSFYPVVLTTPEIASSLFSIVGDISGCTNFADDTNAAALSNDTTGDKLSDKITFDKLVCYNISNVDTNSTDSKATELTLAETLPQLFKAKQITIMTTNQETCTLVTELNELTSS